MFGLIKTFSKELNPMIFADALIEVLTLENRNYGMAALTALDHIWNFTSVLLNSKVGFNL